MFLNTPSRPVAIAADHVLLVVHEPPAHRGGPALYRPREILDRLSRLFVRPALLAPVGPAARDALVSAGASAADMLPFDLHNLIDLNAWPSVSRGSGTERLTIGRHARSDASKWPEKASTVLAAYPNRAWLDVHVLGGPPPEDVMPAVPANWHVLPQDGMDVAAFLARLDVYVWFASSRRIEAFGLALAEAMASGLPVITSRDFEPLFGEGPIYCQPDNVESQLERLRADPERRLMLGAACRRAIRDRFDARLAGRRHERVLSALETAVPPPTPAPRPALRRPRGGVLFVTSNGVGLGHVSRLLAIARKLDPGTPAAFFTLSGAAGVIAEAGFPLDYMPSHLALKLRSTPWNDSLARRLGQAVELFEPDVVVFDGSLPYAGLIAVREARGDLGWVWVRRAMWRSDHDPLGLDREDAFDLIIEPGELAAGEDLGPTVAHRGSVVAIPPVLSAEPGTLEDRAAACARLDLRAEDVNVGVMLGPASTTTSPASEPRSPMPFAGSVLACASAISGRRSTAAAASSPA